MLRRNSVIVLTFVLLASSLVSHRVRAEMSGGSVSGESGSATQTQAVLRYLDIGTAHSCGLLDNNTIKCWGLGSSGQLGYGATSTLGDGAGEMGDALATIDLGTGRTAKQIATGSSHSCAVLDNDTVKCWGLGTNGRLGYGTTTSLGRSSGQMGDALATIDLGTGRTAAAISAGIEIAERLVRNANLCRRQSVSAANLTIGLQCGASDGYSAITANPALGAAVDRLVAAGGRAILSETPEIYGAEHLLVRRAASPDVADTLAERLVWWEEYAARDGASLDNNPSPGNKAGGITTILEKSLGAVAKAGATPLNAVIDYARKVTAPGLTFMDSPGYDPCSATGQIAGGAHLILFTTGRGSVFGSIPSPTIKLASNAALARNMADDIDVDCSGILDGVSVDDMGAQIFARILETSSGQKTASELLGLGE
ncbi:MAG: hypothetical protein RI890_1236, partial [Actinomycetota bacterium]